MSNSYADEIVRQAVQDAEHRRLNRMDAYRHLLMTSSRKGWPEEEVRLVVDALDVAPPTGKPRLLDLFCGGGGATVGYIRAGFEVMGIDNRRQPYYPHTSMGYILGDFCEFGPEWIARWFDAVHASPPCQAHTPLRRVNSSKRYRDLIPATRELLKATGLPYVMENVPGAPMTEAFTLCGSIFGLPITRHRLFESNVYMTPEPCSHYPRGGKLGRHLNFMDDERPESDYRSAMGVDWMSVENSRQAIPPAYTEWIGGQLLKAATGWYPRGRSPRRSVASDQAWASRGATQRDRAVR